MSNLRNLFIVTDEGIFLGRGKFHRELADKLRIERRFLLGGGVFDQRSKRDTFILFGESFDFGKCDKEFLEIFISKKKVYWRKKPLNSIFEVDDDRVEKESDRF